MQVSYSNSIVHALVVSNGISAQLERLNNFEPDLTRHPWALMCVHKMSTAKTGTEGGLSFVVRWQQIEAPPLPLSFPTPASPPPPIATPSGSIGATDMDPDPSLRWVIHSLPPRLMHEVDSLSPFFLVAGRLLNDQCASRRAPNIHPLEG